MSARLRTRFYTFAGPVVGIPLSDIFTSRNDDYFSSIAIRANGNNVSTIVWSDPNGDFGGYIEPGEAISFDVNQKFIKTADIQVWGTADDAIYLTLIS
jgi:hypothetical protein